jgi:hypothetical protein
MRLCTEQSNGLVSLSPFRSWPGCIINTSGYNFRKGQGCITNMSGFNLRQAQVMRGMACDDAGAGAD